jgi:tellurite resistance protein
MSVGATAEAKAQAMAEGNAPHRPQRPTPALARAPMSLFAIVMGLGGTAIAWRKAHVVIGAPAWVGEALMAAAVLAYLVIFAVQSLRAFLYPGVHLAEFRHGPSSTFIPASTIATALMAAALTPYAPPAAAVIWVVAASLHLCLAFLLLRRWFTERRPAAAASPSWFIPVVGNILMPVIGMPLGFAQASWFLFSVGFVFWAILAPLMTHRLFFEEPLPERAVPSLFILLAPPAVGGLAMIALNGGATSVFSHVMFGFAVFVAALTASLIGRVVATNFAIGWWALTFPSAAFATLALSYADAIPGLVIKGIAFVALAAVTVIVGMVLAKTLRALVSGNLIPAD